MSASFFAKILPILVLPAAAHAELSLEQELLSSYDEVTHALKGQPTLSCDLSDPGPLEPNRPKVRIRSKNPIFNQAPNFALTLQGPFSGFDFEVSAGSLAYRTLGGKIVSMPIELHRRGEFRGSTCAFPPFKIVLPKRAPGAVFGRSDRDLKVVTHCANPPNEAATQRVLQEYTLYRILEASGLHSLLVQLVDVTYLDPTGSFVVRQPAFLIENVKDAQKRYFGTRKRPQKVPSAYLKEEYAFSEWLIENEDYGKSVVAGKMHNAYGISSPDGKSTAIVPYDFDLSMLIMEVPGLVRNPFDDLSYISRFAAESPASREVLDRIIQHEQKILQAIEESPITPANREKLSRRIRTVVQVSRNALKSRKESR